MADILLVDQRYRWQTGNGIPAEIYLSRWPDVAADSDLRSDLVYGEFRVRAAQGKPPDWETFVERFSDLRENAGSSGGSQPLARLKLHYDRK